VSALRGLRPLLRPAPSGRPPPWPIEWLSRLSPRRLELLALALFLPFVAVAGAMVSRFGSEFGAAKVIFLLLALAGGLAAVLELRIGVAVLLAALAFPFRTKLLLGIDLHTSHLIMFLVVAMGLAALYFGRLRAPRGFAVPMLLVILGALLASAAGPDTGGALSRLAFGLLPALLAAFVAACVIRPERDLEMLVIVVAASLAGTSLATLYQAAGGTLPGGAPTPELDRANGFFDHPNILGGYLTANILLLLGVAAYAWRRFPLAPLLFLGPLGLALAALATTLSRGALLSLAVGVVATMVMLAVRRHVVSLIAVVLVIALTLLVVIPRVPKSEREKFAERVQKLVQPATETGRPLIWRQARITIGEYPLTGVGPLAFGPILKRSAFSPGFIGGLTHAHNVFLESYLSLGPLGFLGFLWLAGGAIARLWRATRPRAGIESSMRAGWAVGSLGALVSMLVQGMVDFLFWQVEFLAFLLLLIGLGYAIGRPREEQVS
jgi:O-antigen ligase